MPVKSVECGMGWSATCGLQRKWTVEWGMQCVGYEVRFAECAVSSVKCNLQAVQCKYKKYIIFRMQGVK